MDTSSEARRTAVSRALDAISDPLTGKGLIAAGRIGNLMTTPEGGVVFAIEAPAAAAPRYGAVRDAAEAAVRRIAGVTKVTAVLTAHFEGPAPKRQAEGVPHVRTVIAVSSAKGGVGKSTVAVNLAAAIAGLGRRTGLLDVDVYGPSLPTLLGISGRKPEVAPGKRLIPIQAHGLATMSIGYVVDPDQAIVWRGAMATSAVRQMIDEVAWGDAQNPLDVLVIDLPPGTGDVQLTLAQRIPLDGAVIVSTPQEMALADVRRGLAMFEKMRVPVLGVIENMAWLDTPQGRLFVFGEGGARRTADEAGAPFLGALPIDVALRESADSGTPFVVANPGHPLSLEFRRIGEAALANAARAARPAPTIRFE